LNVIPIKVPPLRERTDDIPELAKEFIHSISKNANLRPKEFSEDALEMLKRYLWPGNVRELKNLVERLVIMAPEDIISPKDIPAPCNQEPEIQGGLEACFNVGSFKEAKVNFEKAFIEKKLREFKGNISQTAEAIGLERSNLHKKIKAYSLDDFRS
jgi:two-component system nitrogen regulation response regulator NtrX